MAYIVICFLYNFTEYLHLTVLAHVEVRGQLCGVEFVLSFHSFSGSGHQTQVAWLAWGAPLPTGIC